MGEAAMSAAEIARALGGARRGSGGWWNCRCPVCGGDGKLGLKGGRGKLAVNCFKGCTRAEVISEIHRRGLLQPGATPAAKDPDAVRRQNEADAAARRAAIANAMDIWRHETFPGNESKAHVYLYSRLCLIDPLPETIRYRYAKPRIGRPHAMVCRIDHVEFGSIGIHCTFLNADGSGKTDYCGEPRITIGRRDGGAVWLGDPKPDKWLVVGEGIETTLSVALALGAPGWAALCAGGIKSLVLPPEAQKVVIAADNDTPKRGNKDGAGAQAANWAAARWRGEGRAVQIMMPPVVGSDWNDVLMGREPQKRPAHDL
jgi:hypothetical protein